MTQDIHPAPSLTVLGIETSCDETAAAVVRLTSSGAEVLADRIASQVDEHALYGGVVPEIAARAHVERLDGLIALAMGDAGLSFSDLDAVAATAGPGLVGGVMVGLSTGKAIALAAGKPFLAVNHLEGHALSPRLMERAGAAGTARGEQAGNDVAFPYLLLLVSGGHCQFLSVNGVGRYSRLGSTIDDAAGEAFDKTAKLLGLSGSGGPAVEREALRGNPHSVELPRPLLDRTKVDMSFSGLKTAVRRAAEAEPLTHSRRADICASFQAAVADILCAKARRAIEILVEQNAPPRSLVVAGGVAANGTLRARLKATAHAAGIRFFAPPMRWCTDNAAMIALAGAERLRLGESDPLDAPARARWPLDGASAETAPVYGGGKKGAKA